MTSMDNLPVKVEKSVFIKISIDGREFTITQDKAKELFNNLNRVLGYPDPDAEV